MIRHKILDVWVKGNNPASHEVFSMYELTCIKCGKTISINLADPNYINKIR